MLTIDLWSKDFCEINFEDHYRLIMWSNYLIFVRISYGINIVHHSPLFIIIVLRGIISQLFKSISLELAATMADDDNHKDSDHYDVETSLLS